MKLQVCILAVTVACFTNGVLADEDQIFENSTAVLGDGNGGFDTEIGGQIVKHRSKRFITFNVQAPFFVGLLLSIPITLILPSMANLFNKRKRRAVTQAVDYENYEDSPFIQPNLEKMSNYFDLLQISEPACQERAVCEMSASPNKYFPVSELLLKQINVPNKYALYKEDVAVAVPSNTTRVKRSLFRDYTKSADHGLEKGESACHHKFKGTCPYTLENRLNMPVLRFWQALASVLKLTFTDAS